MSSVSLFSKLQALGAGEFTHLNGSLEAHLLGVHNLLKKWDAPEKVCTAGLFHACYGTAGFAEQLFDVSLRDDVASLIGDDVEKLVYLYCACDRDTYYPRIGTPTQLMFADRFTGYEYEIELSVIKNLCELVLANELEIASHDTAESREFIAKYGDGLRELFNRMQGLVSDRAFAEFQELLGK